MQDQVVLVNKKHKTFFCNLYHEIVCRRLGVCSCRKVKVRTANGKIKTRKSPAGLHIFPKAESAALPRAVLLVPEVRTAVKEGRLAVRQVETVAPVVPVVEPQISGQSTKKKAASA